MDILTSSVFAWVIAFPLAAASLLCPITCFHRHFMNFVDKLPFLSPAKFADSGQRAQLTAKLSHKYHRKFTSVTTYVIFCLLYVFMTGKNTILSISDLFIGVSMSKTFIW